MAPRQTIRSVRIPKDFPRPSRIPPETGGLPLRIFGARVSGDPLFTLCPFSIGDVKVLGPRGLHLWLHRPCISAQPCDRPSLRAALELGNAAAAESKYYSSHRGDKTAPCAGRDTLRGELCAALSALGASALARGSGAWRRSATYHVPGNCSAAERPRNAARRQILQALQILQHFRYSLDMHQVARRTILGSLLVFLSFSFAIPDKSRGDLDSARVARYDINGSFELCIVTGEASLLGLI